MREDDLKYRLAFDTMPDGYAMPAVPCHVSAPDQTRNAGRTENGASKAPFKSVSSGCDVT